MKDLTQAEMLRYSRHLIMPEVGLEGQKKLKAASVLLVGTGGLGSPVALYLAAAGVGRIGLVDYDVVDDSEPAAPGAAWHRPGGNVESRVRPPASFGIEPVYSGGCL